MISGLANAQTFSQLAAFTLTTGSRDAATVVTLPPGAYTVQVGASMAGSTRTGGTGTGGTGTGSSGTGTSATGGDVLVEIYFVE